MRFTQIALVAAAAFTNAAIAGKASIVNKCYFPVYLHSFGSYMGPMHTLTQNESYTEDYRVDPFSSGITFKITTIENGLATGSPQLHFDYTLLEATNNDILYSLSETYGEGYGGVRLTVVPSEESTECSPIDWPNGDPPAVLLSYECTPPQNLTLILCNEKE
jgi:hypothetical protein